ncbi:methyltransferase domain-containing protein [Candidatus Nitrosopumilus sediminis]|uniref:Methyltransferase type 11 n=1 Tax=Candidatus Nitrosopumilus sediminis TaxID=1229909 RepID=K0BCV0_9ARCH|nr:methyltransferase domain-containing protein [Candidatus Nitrosopumilus sediminis]AFS83289.1 methyltransferase type 11 [Candidatus Nitrosopumilus sediminis]
MLESSLEFLRCVRCGSKLELNAFKLDKEIEEGILECKKCNLEFPIIDKIPVLWDDFTAYISPRKKLGSKLYQSLENQHLKKFLKSSLSKNPHNEDRTELEERWSKIYENSRNSKFYSLIKGSIDNLPKSDLVLEHGCSIGIMTSYLADSNKMVFGVDRSFSALQIAKKSYKNNLDYFIADSLSSVFGKLQFSLILALNILELIEPMELLKHMSKQISSGYLVISEPYDFDRGTNSVRKPLDEFTLRTTLNEFDFKITAKTKKPSYLPWNLKLNPRATLNYKVDFIIGKK